jgi:hypothetical protein
MLSALSAVGKEYFLANSRTWGFVRFSKGKRARRRPSSDIEER